MNVDLASNEDLVINANNGYGVSIVSGSLSQGTSTASGNYSSALGDNLQTASDNIAEHAVGRYNCTRNVSSSWGTAGNTLFTVGAGTEDIYRLNALEIHQDGKVYVRGLDGWAGTNNPATTGHKDLVSAIKEASVAPLVSVEWLELQNKCSNRLLIPGQQYRITDYVATTTQANTQSANKRFDIIVVADSVNKLNENARAMLHDGDSYFSSSNLSAWKLKYCLNNDTNRFAWADSSAAGRGVIYWMQDEFGNECPYDFKGIKFKRWAIFNVTSTKLNENELTEFRNSLVYNENFTPCYSWKSSDIDLGGIVLWVDSVVSDFYFTFSKSTNGADASLKSYVHNNKIEPYIENNKITLNSNVLFDSCYCNKFGNRCYSNTLCGSCYYNVFDNLCFQNIFTQYCEQNIFGEQCVNNVFSSFCSNNVFGYGCQMNVFGKACDNNTFYNNCNGNTFNNQCSSNIFDNNCLNNEFANFCNQNTLGVGCASNILGESCNNNVFGNDSDRNVFGSLCTHNTLGTYCGDNEFGNGCDYNSFGNNCNSNAIGNSCASNIFENSCTHMALKGENTSNNSFRTKCSYITLWTNCQYNTFGSNCQSITLGTSNNNGDCQHNSFGNSCNSIWLGHKTYTCSFGNECKYICFGSNEGTANTKRRYRYIAFEDGVEYVKLNRTSDDSSDYYQNVLVARGFNNTTTYKTISDANYSQTYTTIYQPTNSQIISY